MPEERPDSANRYLIVVGGTGKGLLGKRSALNFLHEWQIDVDSEKFSNESAHFSFVPLDTFIGVAAALAHFYLNQTPPAAGNFRQASPYLKTWVDTEAVKNHRSVYWNNVGAAMLKFGLAQEPAIGAATARYPDNEHNLRAKLARISEGVGLDRGVEVWIVSSTAGGTGQGIHRYIAALVADILSTTNCSVHIHFVQIGQETYGTAGNKCTLNTFFGVAADVAFSHLLTDIYLRAVPAWYYLDLRNVGVGEGAKKLRAELVEMSVKTIMNQNVSYDLNQLVINNNGLPFVLARTGFWGKDFDETSKYKQTLNTLLAKLKELLMPAEDMPERAKKLVAATSEADKPKFHEAARYSELVNRAQSSAAIETWLSANNRVPAYPSTLRSAPPPAVSAWPPELRAAATDLVSGWKIAFRTMGITVDELGTRYSFNSDKDGQITEQDLAYKKIPGTDKLNKSWESAVGQASKAKLWCHYMLEGFSTVDAVPSLLAQFMTQAQQAAKVDKNWLLSSAKKSKQLAPVLGKLLAVLAKIVVIEKSLKQTQTHLDEALRSAKQTAEFAATILEALAAAADMQPTILTSNISDVMNEATEETWLSTMHRRAEQNDARAFRTAVLAGATGLTMNGLREVLDLPPTADVKEIAEELVRDPAEVTVGGGRTGAKQVAPMHWQQSLPSGITKEYFYRLLPQVGDATQTELLQVPSSEEDLEKGKTLFTEHNITCAFEKMGRTGLYVMAFHGMSLSHKRGSDYFSAAKYMLRPMLNYVRNELNHWEDDQAMIGAAPTGNYNVAACCAIGEPLDLTALIAAGLTEDEIAKVASYYLIYSKPQPAGNQILDGAAAVIAARNVLLPYISEYLH